MAFSARGIRKAMEAASPGHFTDDSVKFYDNLLQNLTEQIIPDARKFAFLAGRKRISSADIKIAAEKWIRK